MTYYVSLIILRIAAPLSNEVSEATYTSITESGLRVANIISQTMPKFGKGSLRKHLDDKR